MIVMSYQHEGKINAQTADTILSRPRLERGVGFRGRKGKLGGSYDWRLYAPKSNNIFQYLRWTIVGGGSFAEVSDDDRISNLQGLALCIRMLREYKNQFGMPDSGGVKDQGQVLREVTRDLYEGATPLWALEYVMQRAAEGLTGHSHVNWMLLPRKGFMYIPANMTTIMFNMVRGFLIYKMERIEPLAVRLASFATNTVASSSIQAKFPTLHEFEQARKAAELEEIQFENAEELAEDILDMASCADGLFYFVNNAAYEKSVEDKAIHDFWSVTEEERELFSRLACREAQAAIRKIDSDDVILYPKIVLTAFRIFASAGACAFWFNGSWWDMIVAGLLAVGVAAIADTSISKQERVIFEVVASFSVGLVSGLIAIQWPSQTCFGAMALAGILDILQGFRVVYAVIQIMSKFSVSGCADLVEGMLFTGLIAYFLRFGQLAATTILNDKDNEAVYAVCTNGIDKLWYILFVPLAAISWSGLFLPKHRSLVPMVLHGCLAYGVNFLLDSGGVSTQMNIFLSAAVVSFSSGLVSRFTHVQAVSSTVAGLYVLLPGAYLVTAIYNESVDGSFFVAIVERAVGVGIGAWTGSMLCSPTLLGTTRGLANQSRGASERGAFRDEKSKVLHNTLLVF